MKKIALFIFLAVAFCCQIKAQCSAYESSANDLSITTQLSLAANLPSGFGPADPIFNNTINSTFYTNEQFASQASDPGLKIFGGVCMIVSGGSMLTGGLGMTVIGFLFQDILTDFGVNNSVDPEFEEGSNMVVNVFKYAGIGVSVVGAGLLTGGIFMIKSAKNGGKGSNGSVSNGQYVNKNTRNSADSKKYKHKRRHAENLELMTPQQYGPSYNLSFNVGPSAGALTLTF